ncbi:uncharacterized protein [Procambarus clarkii]|uniref:uncharacterized protein n=1 Tax=Procambarus clarkii TaxID=6728 RepID=UPI00374256C5
MSFTFDHHDKITEALEEKQNADVVCMDFPMAFDRSNYGVIAYKMRSIGIKSRVMDIQFPVKQNTKRNNKTKSSSSTVKSSVPQGIILVPLLFLIFISDIDKNRYQTFVSAFADTKFITNITHVEGIEKLV